LAFGAKYTGDWNNDLKHGFGEYVWPDGDSYEGDWVMNVRTG